MICSCQNGMVGTEFCQCSIPTADSISPKNNTCASCGKFVQIYGEPMSAQDGDLIHVPVTESMVMAFLHNLTAAYSEGQGADIDLETRWCLELMRHFPKPFEKENHHPAVVAAKQQFGIKPPEPVTPQKGGCWFCQNATGNMLFNCEFDTHVHKECLINAMRNDRHPETTFMFNEHFMNEGDVLLAEGQKLTGRCFALANDGCWWESSYKDGEVVKKGELICVEMRRNFPNALKRYMKDGGKQADSFKHLPPRGNA